MNFIYTAVKFYSVFLIVALGVLILQNRLSLSLFINLELSHFTTDLTFAIAATALMVGLSLYANKNFLWAQVLNIEFKKLFVPLKDWHIFLIAFCSGITEETVFRGIIQPLIGIFPTSFLFGLLHLIPNKIFIPWTLYTMFGGFLFGCLFEMTGNLFPSIISHILINFIMIHLLNHSENSHIK
jgi:membrane protease YdiL (CAAX protease family)